MLRVGMPMSLTYATDLFDESTVVSFAERFGSGSHRSDVGEFG